MSRDSSNTEKAYAESLSHARRRVKRIGQADVVVGIPFRDEVGQIGGLCQTVAKGLSDLRPSRKSVIVCVGAADGRDAMEAVEKVALARGTQAIRFLMSDDSVSGLIWRVRALVEIADRLSADLVLFEPDLESGDSRKPVEGLSPDWVRRLMLPLEEEGMDLVLPRFSPEHLGATASNQMVCPLIASVFNTPLMDLPGGTLGISNRLVRAYRDDAALWADEVEPCSLDTLLVTSAIMQEASICETALGVKLQPACADEDTVWRQQAKTIFGQITAAQDWWQQRGEVFYPPAAFGEQRADIPQGDVQDPAPLLARFKEGFSKFQGLYEEILSREPGLCRSSSSPTVWSRSSPRIASWTHSCRCAVGGRRATPRNYGPSERWPTVRCRARLVI
jgi:hypothetical protein